jgi:hypothetical protein
VNSLGPGVDHLVADGLVFGPVRDQAPAETNEDAFIILVDDDRDNFRRRDIESRLWREEKLLNSEALYSLLD